MTAPFVGRARELEVLEAALDPRRALAASPAVALLVGAPGSGKSRLVRELALRATGYRSLRITAYEPEQDVPLAAARHLLTTLMRAPRHGNRLHALTFGDPAGVRGTTTLQIFETAYRCVRELGQCLVMLDDLQWADDRSTALISYLLRASAADGYHLAVVVASRPSPTFGAFADTVDAILGGGPRAAQISLAPLTEDEGIAMVRGLVPRTTPSDAARIWQLAAGSPFWIEALSLDGEGATATIGRRFARLGPDAAVVLQTIALVGRPAEIGELAAVVGWPDDRVSAGVRELTAQGLIHEAGRDVQTAHDLIREAAVCELPDSHARRLHSRIAHQAHAAAGGDIRRLREALQHADAAGESGLNIAVDLAEAAQRRLMDTDGVRELSGVAARAAPDDPTRRHLERQLAELASELGDRALEMERWLAVAEHAETGTHAPALVAASKAAYRMGRRGAAAELIALARATDRLGLAEQISLDAVESEILRWLDHRLPEARTLTTRALLRAGTVLADGAPLTAPLRTACIDALQAACDLALQEGNEREQIDFAEQIAELAEGELEVMDAQLLLASAYRRSGRMGDAEQLARRVRDRAEQRLYPALAVTAGHHLARALYMLARLEEAEAAALESERLAARIGETGRFLSEIRSLRPGIALSRGDWRAGIQRLREDLDGEVDPHYQLGVHQDIAVWLSRLAGSKRADEVREHVRAAQDCLRAVGCPRCGRELALRGAEALAGIGDVDQALVGIRPHLVAATWQSIEGRQFLGQAIGAVRAARGDHRGAARSLARLRERLHHAGAHREALWADLDLGAALEKVDPPAAVATYRSVVERAAAGGVLTDLEVARQRLRGLGVRMATPATTHNVLGLTRRELEVATIAAAGATNPEIAATLFISRKTVERHLSVAMSKVGVRNRTELAARLPGRR